MTEGPIKIVCSTCGSEDVSRDAWANWNAAAQAWKLGAVFDDAYCHDCDSATRLDEVPCSPDPPTTGLAENAIEPSFVVGERVSFWSGRGSRGHGVIRAIDGGRAFIDPDPDAIKGSDYWLYAEGSTRHDFWAPRDFGLRFDHLNTPPKIWHRDD